MSFDDPGSNPAVDEAPGEAKLGAGVESLYISPSRAQTLNNSGF